jgi:Flp pilus assembly protein TadG
MRRVGFARDDRGAVAIEFAILALPFFTLIYAILETSIVFLAGQILDSAVNDASRKVRTGQAQTASWSIDEFRSEMCDGLYGMFDCANVKIAVSTVTAFKDVNIAGTPVDEDCRTDPSKCDWTITEAFTPGVGSDVVLVQAYYKWPTLVNLPGFNLATMADGTLMLSAVRVFKNEPFS